MITNALKDEQLPVYGDGMNVRDWLHVEDHCRAVWAVLEKGDTGEAYNVGGSNEWHNLALIKELLSILDKPESLRDMLYFQISPYRNKTANDS